MYKKGLCVTWRISPLWNGGADIQRLLISSKIVIFPKEKYYQKCCCEKILRGLIKWIKKICLFVNSSDSKKK